LAGAVLTLMLLRACGLDYGWDTVALTFPNLWKAMPRLLVVGLALAVLAVRVSGESVKDFLSGVARPRWIANWVRLWVAVSAQIYAYMWLKVSIPLISARLFDTELWHLDRWLHFGISPTLFAIDLVAGTPLARLADVGYELWVPSVPILFTYFFTVCDDARRRNLALASAVLWIGGAWLYYLLPALGPCYSAPDALEPIRGAMPGTMATQRMLWLQYLQMVRGRSGVVEAFSPMLGVAAMPSLHVGAYAMFALWSRRYARRWFGVFAVATALMFFGSLATGWHYAVDGYAGVLLAWASVRLADRFEPARRSADESGSVGTQGEAVSGPAPEAGGSIEETS